MLRVERWLGLPLHWTLLVVSVVVQWESAGRVWSLIVPLALVIATLTLLLTYRHRWTGRQMIAVTVLSFALDLLLALHIIAQVEMDASLLYLLFAILNIRSIMLSPIMLWPLGLAMLFWPAVVLGIWPRQEQQLLLTVPEALTLIVLAGVSLALAYLYREITLARERARRDLKMLREQRSQQETALRRTSDRLGRQILALRGLEEGTRAMSGTVAQERLLNLIAEKCAAALDARAVIIGTLTEEGELDVAGRSDSLPAATVHAVAYLLRQTTEYDELMQRPPTAALGGPFVALPVRSEQQVIGAIGLLGQQHATFTTDDLERLAAFADQTAVAIMQSRLYSQLAEAKERSDARLAQLKAINAVAQATILSLNLEVILERLLKELYEIHPISHAAVLLLDEDDDVLRPMPQAVKGPVPPPVPLEADPAVREAFDRAQPVPVIMTAKHANPFQRTFAQKWNVNTYVVVPLISRDTPIGALYLGSTEYDSPLDSEDIEVATSLASFAATAVENVRLYAKVRAQSRRLEAIVRDIGDGVFVTDTELRLLLINPKAREIFGLSSSPPSGTPLLEVIPIGDLAALCQNALRDSYREPQTGELSIQVEPSQKKRAYQALASIVMGSDNRPAGVVTVLRDITAQKELEEMKSNFVNVISHELRTPLHSIGGFVDILLMGRAGELNRKQQEYLETVKDQTQYLNRLIEDLLEYNRLESGQIELRLEPVEMGALVNEVVETLMPVAEQNDIHLASSVPRSLITIQADRGRLRQVFTNLVDNALKFTSAGGEVRLSATADSTGVEVLVQDTGIGIPPEALNRIFERFYQVDTGHTRQYHGPGLGLAIVKHLVSQHGGAIWAESTVGEGSVFHVLLPVEPPEERLVVDFSRLPASRNETQ